jgi:hypothetical protein
MPLPATQREERHRERVGEVAFIAMLAYEEMKISVGPKKSKVWHFFHDLALV